MEIGGTFCREVAVIEAQDAVQKARLMNDGDRRNFQKMIIRCWLPPPRQKASADRIKSTTLHKPKDDYACNRGALSDVDGHPWTKRFRRLHGRI